MQGVFPNTLLQNLRVSLLGMVPKKKQGEFRLIHHFSYPESESVNDAIPLELCTAHYTSLAEVVHVVCRCGVGRSLQNVTLN